ncbi:hypothetical protein MIMGU_mgv1a017403mg [Erythranthe guttata]|uniref:Uncharacterized protein n=1 Tax=Erythranthe guttata TaxID=4155 RepID=A0A022Q0K1_ERYGU|nr:hypothetical protein MIMGU_mgv1a017403mg [Erythranthe guttata]
MAATFLAHVVAIGGGGIYIVEVGITDWGLDLKEKKLFNTEFSLLTLSSFCCTCKVRATPPLAFYSAWLTLFRIFSFS